MDEVWQLGLDVGCTSDELCKELVVLPILRLQELRCRLFEEARSTHLVHRNDAIVQ